MPKPIALAPGCPLGVGPELFPKALISANLSENQTFIWCGHLDTLTYWAEASGVPFDRTQDRLMLFGKKAIQIIALEKSIHFDIRKKDLSLALHIQKYGLQKALELAKSQQVSAVVTGPIRKEALQDFDGSSFPGQTELFHQHLGNGSREPLMCFAGAEFTLGLVTVHLPLKAISAQINRARIIQKATMLIEATSRILGCTERSVRLSMLGLNPHAGESGLLGQEEIEILSPAITALKKQDFLVDGPLAADGFFGNLHHVSKEKWPHAVLAMYHDQGLAPYKLLGGSKVANITFGLKIPRTSPSHGTADNLAHTLKADHTSLTSAIEYAISLGRSK